MPWWFTVATPVGPCAPDWAIVKEVAGEPPRLYLVRETKGTDNFAKLEKVEQQKIACGKRHFHALGFNGAHGYEWVDSPEKVEQRQGAGCALMKECGLNFNKAPAN